MTSQQACMSCKARKIRCDRGTSCNNCTKRKVECIYIKHSKPKTANKKDFFERIKHKHAKLENLFDRIIELQSNNNNNNDNIKNNTSPNCNAKFHKVDWILNHDQLNTTSAPPSPEQHQYNCNELIEIYFKFQNKGDYLVAPEKKELLINATEVGPIILKYAICASALNFNNCLNKIAYIPLKDNHYYNECKNMIKKFGNIPSLETIQALIICMFLEMGNGEVYLSSMTNIEAIRLSQSLNYHLLDNKSCDEIIGNAQSEAYFAWIRCRNHDRMISLFFSKPPTLESTYPSRLPDLNFSLKDTMSMPPNLYMNFIHFKLTSVAAYFIEQHHNIIRIKEKAKSPESNINELIKEVDSIMNIMNSLARYELFSFTPEMIKTSETNLVEHPFFLPYLCINQFRATMLVLLYSTKVKLFNINDNQKNEHIVNYLDIITDYRKLGLRLYKFSSTIEDKLKKDTKCDSNHLFYLMHFGHVFNLEWATYPFIDDHSIVGKQFVKQCKDKITELCTLWPIFSKISCKTKGDLSGFLYNDKN